MNKLLILFLTSFLLIGCCNDDKVDLSKCKLVGHSHTIYPLHKEYDDYECITKKYISIQK